MSSASQANVEAFDEAIEEVVLATNRLLGRLVSNAPPKNREQEARKARAKWDRRTERLRASGV